MPLRHALLRLLDWKPMHGYRLRQHATEYSWIYPMTNASIYPALHALEEAGQVSHREEIHRGRARKVYAITEAGRIELRRWLEEETECQRSLRDVMLLKIAMQTDETMTVSRPWVEAALASLEEDIARHRAQLERLDPQADYARLAIEYGASVLDLRKRFLEQVLDRHTRATIEAERRASSLSA